MTRIRFRLLTLFLIAGVVAAVGTLVAQEPSPKPDPERRERARVFRFEGRGSQIGVMVEDVEAGVRIEDVDRDSPAAKAGLREGDIVVEFDGERVRSARQFARLVEESVPGRQVTMAVRREGQQQTLQVTPEDRALAWGIDGDRIGREIARGMRNLEPRLRQFRIDPPGLSFDWDWDMVPGSPRGRLGVQIDSLTPQLAEYFGVKDGGVLVSSVASGSAAEKAGLRAGDVITSIDGDRVRDYDDLMRGLRGKTGEITIGIVRDKQETTLKATIEQPQARTRRLRPAIHRPI